MDSHRNNSQLQMLLYSNDVADATNNGRPRTDEGTTIYRSDFYV